MKIQYNSPVVLSFALTCTALLIIDAVTGGAIAPFFTVGSTMHVADPVDWFRLFSHVLGHAGVQHLMGNMMLILLLGPMLEEKYGPIRLLGMIVATALITGLLNVLIFPGGLRGASGIAFMFILLSSVTNARRGYVPLTFVLVVVLYLGQEIWSGLGEDNVSQFAHIIGGLCGAAFGFLPQSSRAAKPDQ